MKEHIYCSQQAFNTSAQLCGSAVQVDSWLLIEYAQSWHAKALANNQLPEVVNQHIENLPTEFNRLSNKKLRVLFIKQSERPNPQQPYIMLAQSSSAGTALIRSQLSSYTELCKLSAQNLIDKQLPNGKILPQQMYLICTNGQRDLCCGRFGIPLYKHLQENFGERIWQTTHIGGHRFAPNLLCLPSGIVYGFVRPDESSQLVHAMDSNILSLKHLRGRSHYPPVAQAAEYFLRNSTDTQANHALTLVNTQELGDTSEVNFIDTENCSYLVTLRKRVTNIILPSCEAAPTTGTQFDLKAIITSNH